MQEFDSGPVSATAVMATVKWYDPEKGFGFLTPADGSRDLFCHVSALGRAGLVTLAEGATVTCEVVQGRQGPQVEVIHGVDDSTVSLGGAGSRGAMRGEHGHAHHERGASHGRRVVASVKWFVPAKGFGFLETADGSPDVFCHVSVVEEAGYETLPAGASVTCEVTEGRRGPVVSSILAVDAPAASAERARRDEQWQRRRDREPGYGEAGGPAEARWGLVKFYNAAKGYGFVVPDDGGPDVFLHGSVLNRAGLGALDPGQRVSVMVARGARGPQATDIELI